MIIVDGWVRVAPGDIERLREAASIMVAATRAEPGCLEYAFAVDLVDPLVLRVTERWSDEAALAAHFRTPHLAAFNQALGELRSDAARVTAYSAEFLRSLVAR